MAGCGAAAPCSLAGSVLGPAMVGRSGQHVSASHANGTLAGGLAGGGGGGGLQSCGEGHLGSAVVARYTCGSSGSGCVTAALGWLWLLPARHASVHEVPLFHALPLSFPKVGPECSVWWGSVCQEFSWLLVGLLGVFWCACSTIGTVPRVAPCALLSAGERWHKVGCSLFSFWPVSRRWGGGKRYAWYP